MTSDEIRREAELCMVEFLRDVAGHLLTTFGHVVHDPAHPMGLAQPANPAAVEIANALSALADRMAASVPAPALEPFEDARLAGLRLAADTARRAVKTFGSDGVHFLANVLRNMVKEFEGRGMRSAQEAALDRALTCWRDPEMRASAHFDAAMDELAGLSRERT